MPSRGAAAFRAASNCPGDLAPSGQRCETFRCPVGLQEAYEARLRREHRRKNSFWDLVD
jgi:hypothetical protein